MYFDDQNKSSGVEPVNGGAEQNAQSAAPGSPAGENSQPSSGEYHFTGGSAPTGSGTYNPNLNAASNTGSAGAGFNGYQPGYGGPVGSGYQPSYSQPNNGAGAQPRRGRRGNKPPKPPKPPKQKRSMGAGAVVALALVFAIVGGLVGGGGLYLAASKGLISVGSGSASVAVSDRTTKTDVTTTKVKAGDAMTPAQIYSTYGSAVVSVTVETSSGEGAGTGFIIDADNGYIMTCYHVVDGATAISATLNDTTSYEATYVGGDEDQDVAILKVTPGEDDKLTAVTLGDSSLLSVGDTVSAIGNALGTLANTLTTGTVSAMDRAITMSDGTVMNLLQTDTTINSGNSGGPLFNEYGEVVGIVNAKYSSSAYDTSTASIEGIGFAIPINDATAIMNDLMKYGYVTGKPYLGISVSTVSSVTAQQYDNMVVGAYVNSVSEGSCAEAAGLQVGDIITQVDGTDITTSAELIDAKNTHKAGEEMTLTVYRDKEYVTLKVTLDEEQPEDDTSSDSDQQNGNSNNGNSNNGGNGYSYSFPYGYGGW